MDIVNWESESLFKKYKKQINAARIFLFSLIAIWTITGLLFIQGYINTLFWISQILFISFFILNLFTFKKPFIIMSLLALYAFGSTFGSTIVLILLAKIAITTALLIKPNFILALILHGLLNVIMIRAVVAAKKYEQLITQVKMSKIKL